MALRGAMLAVPLGLTMALPAAGAACLQKQAVYADPDSLYELRFEPVGEPKAATSHHFKLKVVKTGLGLDGIVMHTDEPARTYGMVMHDCPEGDVTGAEITACTIWEGVLYVADGKGKIGLLPDEEEEAAEQILLPGLGPAVRASALWERGKLENAPWDVLEFRECAQ